MSNASECFLIEYVLFLRLKCIVLQRLTHLPDESVIILTRHTETHGLFGHVLNSNRINAYPKTFSLTYIYGSLQVRNLYSLPGMRVCCNWRRWVGHFFYILLSMLHHPEVSWAWICDKRPVGNRQINGPRCRGRVISKVLFKKWDSDCGKATISSPCLSARPHGTSRLEWDLIFVYFSKICREISTVTFTQCTQLRTQLHTTTASTTSAKHHMQ